ncbi:alpha/beta hydrolase [Yoonia sp. R2331]|uniref:alpha/beta hydrolase n=1 Tax=Yoonia sp. R2331 TaxID=3237238 RepID=UPI0034E48EDC
MNDIRIPLIAGFMAVVAVVAILFGNPIPTTQAPEVEPLERHGGAASEGSEPPIAEMAPPEEPVVIVGETENVGAAAPLEERAVEMPVEVMPEPIIIEEAMEMPAPFEEDETHRDVPIFFATNRALNDDPDFDDPASTFTDDYDVLRYGTGIISIPREHRMGELESQGWFASLMFDPDIEKHVILQDLTPWTTEEVMQMLAGELQSSENAILMYVHGFNTSLDKAARRAGQLTYDLAWDGPSFLFSWPSRGRAINYLSDSTMAQRSVPDLKRVLRDLAAQDPDRIIVIAHSMGTRIISEAMAEMVAEDDPAVDEITTIVLAAPDIDEVVFRTRIAPRFREATSTHFTLYASAEDSALKASKEANGFRRIGDTTDGVPQLPGIDVIDATGVVSDFFGHTYFGDNTSILSDIYEMVHTGSPVNRRAMLAPVPPEPPTPEAITHWRINLQN